MRSYLFATTLLTTIFFTSPVCSQISADEINQLYQEQISPSPLGGNILTQEDLDLINHQSQYLSVFENTNNILSYNPNHNCQAGDSSGCLPIGVYNILGANELTIGDILSESLSANDFRNTTLLDSAERPHGFDQQTLINYCSLVGSCYLAHNNDPVLIGVAGRLAYLISLDLHYVGVDDTHVITHQSLDEHPQLSDLYQQIFQELLTLPPQELLNGGYKSKIIGFIDQLNLNIIVPSLTGYLTERLEQSYYDVTEQTIDTFMVENPEFDPDTTFGDLLAISPAVSDFFSSQKLYDVFGQLSIWDEQELSNYNSDYIAASKAIAHIPGASNYDANNLPVATMAADMIKGFMADTIYKYSELARGKIPNQPFGRLDLVLGNENYAFNTISGGYGKNQYVKGSYGCINYKSELPGMSFPRQQLIDQGGELARKCSHIELQPFFKVNNPDGEFKLDMGTPGLQWVAGDAQQVRGGKNFPLNQMFNRHEPTGIPIPLEIQEIVLTSAKATPNGGDLGAVPSFSSVDDLGNMMNTSISPEELQDLLSGKTIEKYAQLKDSLIADFKQMGQMIANNLPVPILGNPTVKMLVRDLDESTGTAPNQKTRIIKAFEDEFHLCYFVEYEYEGKKIGAKLLQKPGKEDYQVLFTFECKGIHPSLRINQLESALEQLENGLKELPRDEKLMIYMRSYTESTDRKWQLQDLVEKTTSPELKFLLVSEIQRLEQLTEKGIRKNKSLLLTGSYTITSTVSNKKTDLIESFLEGLEEGWHKVSGVAEELKLQKIETILRNAYLDGYQFWEQYLSNKLELQIIPLTSKEIWENLWERFNHDRPLEIPQLVRITEETIRIERNSQYHPLSYMLHEDNAVPIADRKWVKVKDKYIAANIFAEKPAGWKDKSSQLRYLWKILSQERIYDIDIVVEISGGNPAMLKESLQSLAKQANLQSQESEAKNSFDVNANLKIEKALKAQYALYGGEQPIKTSVVFLLYRDTLAKLDEDCKYLSSLFVSPAWVIREMDYAWKIWLQTFGLKIEKLLATPFDRRSTYLTSEAPGLLPLVRTRLYDKQGFELIANEGGTPLFIDIFNKHRNIGIFSTTRGGKSVLISGILLQALARGIPITAIDYPKPDGTGTFSDFSVFLGQSSSYYDIGKESNNIFEPPNLQGLNPELQKERFKDYQEFLLEILVTMVLGLTPRIDVNPDSVRSLITLAMEKFFNDPDIRERYATGFINGFGSNQWWEMPTLSDFIPYCSLERLQLLSPSEDIIKSLEFTKLRFRFWLESRVGQSLSRPTSFRADAPFMIVAMRNLNNEEDAAILSLGVYMAALRRSLAHPASIFFIDEAPILFQYESLASLVARLCANGAKSGIRVILSAQEPESIAQSKSSSKIFANLTTRLVGRIQPTAIDAFVDILKYPREIINVNASEAYFPKKEGLYSQWLLDDSGYFTPCRYYPSHLLLACVANNPDESALRKSFLERYPNNKWVAYAEFQRAYVEMIMNEG